MPWVKISEGAYQFQGKIPTIEEYHKALKQGIDLLKMPDEEIDYTETEP